MTNLHRLLEVDDMPITGDATIGLLRYAAKKDKSKRFNRQTSEGQKLSLARAS
jgi:hypothetical protein